MNENEKWIDIEEYEGIYQVSNFGRIKSLDRYVEYKDGRTRFFKGKIRKLILNKHRGYFYVTFKVDGKSKTQSVHKLVADNFIGYESGKVVDHIDNNKLNNNLSNLRYITNRENLSKRVDSGICYHIRSKKWTAYIWLNGKIKHLGYFKDKKQAKKKRLEALKKISNA